MKKKSFNMNLMLLLFSMIPLVVTVVGMTIMAVVLCTSNLENKVEDQLEVAARGLKFYTEYELKNGTATEITYDSEYIDILKADDVDLTVFVGDTRLCTSVLNDNGQRNEGTKAADGIWDKVSKGETFINDNTKVAGKDYYVVYLPITDASNKVIGMAFAGTPRSDISSAKRNIILISVITAIILMVVFGGIVIILSKKVSTPLRVTAESLEVIAKGDLTAENELESAVAETDSLIQSYKGLQSNISRMLGSINSDATDLATRVKEVAQLAEQSNSSTEQINSAIAELADGATSMAQNVQNINEQVMEMGGLINNVVESVELLSNSSSAMQTANNEAYGYITNLKNHRLQRRMPLQVSSLRLSIQMKRSRGSQVLSA